MQPSSRPSLTDVHAVMDDVSALQAQSEPRITRHQLTLHVQQMYERLGMDVDPQLVKQAVARRLAGCGTATDSGEATFDFGWERPNNAQQLQAFLERRAWVTRMARNGLGACSSLAFCVWAWMVFWPAPTAWNHPWWFALLCMGAGSGVETWVDARARRDRRWMQARKPSRKQVKKWQHSPQALAYLSAVMDSTVPLLNADLPHLRDRVKQDEQLANVRGLVK